MFTQLVKQQVNKCMTITITQEQFIVDANGNKTAVILSIQQYERILEDMHDLAIVAERRSEQSISLAGTTRFVNASS